MHPFFRSLRFCASAVAICASSVVAFAQGPHTAEPLGEVQQNLKEKKAILVDVREKPEWEAGHLQQAQFLPLSELGKRLQDRAFIEELRTKLPEDKIIYLHCKAGGRCVLAAEALKKELGPGYQLRALKPGYEQLLDAGFPKATENTK